jgi:hypothetical protein
MDSARIRRLGPRVERVLDEKETERAHQLPFPALISIGGCEGSVRSADGLIDLQVSANPRLYTPLTCE